MAVGVNQQLVARLHPRLAVVCTALFAVLSLAGWTPSPLMALAIAVGAVVVGMPHGALDVTIGPKLVDWKIFFPLYGAAIGATVAAWLVAPRLSLAVFLALSWVHFGAGDTKGFELPRFLRLARGTATGGLVLGLPLLFHADIVVPIFDSLLLGTDTFTHGDARIWGTTIGTVALVSAAVVMVAHVQKREWLGAIEIALLCVLGAITSPLIAFSVYFALWHSPRHLIETAPTRRQIMPTLVATFGTLIVGAGIWFVYTPSWQLAVRVVFIGLAALTVPHLVVTTAFSRHRQSSPPVVHTKRGLTIHRLRPVR